MVRTQNAKSMKCERFFMLLLMAIFIGSPYSYGEISKTTLKHAVRVLKGIDSDDTKEWAVETLETAACIDSSSYAMNCLGIAYMVGVGVDADSTKAVLWLEKAGEHGYVDAYHNLGMIYKYSKCGVTQDFRKAYEYFSVGTGKGSIDCMYDEGFMLYKGLGCVQNYAKAVELFRLASEASHSPSLYMLGLCYRNGYGVEKDATMAEYYLNRSAMLGYKDAEEEMERDNAETYLHDFLLDIGAPNKMPLISSEINDTSLISGRYHGFLVMYDWSGCYLLGEKPMTMNICKNGVEIEGVMILGADTVSIRASVADDNKLTFNKGDLKLHDRYVNDAVVKYRLDNMLYDVWNDKICGRLNLYSLKQREPERPMYFELQREGTLDKTQKEKSCLVAISPNPFENQFDVRFDFADDTNVMIRIFNVFGMMVWQQDIGILGKGTHQVTLSPNIVAGKYVVSIRAGKQVLHSIIKKEGGTR